MGDFWRCLQKEASMISDALLSFIGSTLILAIRMAFAIGEDGGSPEMEPC
jgi:hypothetical protein